MHWASAYLGEPYAPTLEANCLGLARRVYRDQGWGDLVGLLGLVRAARGGDFPADEVEHPSDGDLVVLGTAPHRPATHVGLYVSAAGLPPSVLHADDGPGCVVLTRLRLARLAWPFVGYLRPHCREAAKVAA